MALLFLVGGAFALVSQLAFLLAGIFVLAAGSSAPFSDLTPWGVVSLVLAVLSFFGWREIRSTAATSALEPAELPE